MARIARRGLRLQNLPVLSLPSPWGRVADAENVLAVGSDESRYLELARRVEPGGSEHFGYAAASSRRKGGVGVLVEARQVRWLSPAACGHQAVHLTGHGVRPFRILAMRAEAGPIGEPPLYTARVQLLLQRDIARLDKAPKSDACSLRMLPSGVAEDGAAEGPAPAGAGEPARAGDTLPAQGPL
uniref:Uncharacterized protein n=1 Tax=Pyrodinium bahamense TaxID=73915 RepID=A0A7S0AL06_9DINO|mmetsp:Transcript_3660/g.10054  ORF Transcript_3660/g.10054 Transcript_3660/m.10054 type:complete len:184 (+) Transcript_3660:62-613(+)